MVIKPYIHMSNRDRAVIWYISVMPMNVNFGIRSVLQD